MEKTESRKKDLLAGLIVLAIYTAGLIVISCFHELTFDESQAWLIAKCASYKEILTYIPHYEGHPPLWHLILSVFAKNGVPVDLSLKAVNITFSTAAMALLIFRSPFPKVVRFILPFTYYFFYQYGVIVRPYGLMLLVLILEWELMQDFLKAALILSLTLRHQILAIVYLELTQKEMPVLQKLTIILKEL